MDASYQSAPLRFFSPDELDRAARYRLEKDRRSFVQRRSVLRVLLSRYAGISPSDVVLSNVPGEKPRFLNSPSPAIHFSTSTSNGLAVLAITRSGSVGIDTESVRPLEDLNTVAQDVLADEEFALVSAECTQAERERAFFSVWTRKEAVLKCTGEGLPENLRLVNVFDFGERLWNLKLAQGYVSALACAARLTHITVLEGPLNIDELMRILPDRVKSSKN